MWPAQQPAPWSMCGCGHFLIASGATRSEAESPTQMPPLLAGWWVRSHEGMSVCVAGWGDSSREDVLYHSWFVGFAYRNSTTGFRDLIRRALVGGGGRVSCWCFVCVSTVRRRGDNPLCPVSSGDLPGKSIVSCL